MDIQGVGSVGKEEEVWGRSRKFGRRRRKCGGVSVEDEVWGRRFWVGSE